LGKNEYVPPVSGDTFKALMRKIASSVAVITTCHDGHRHGMTATAVCSVSVDPPAILIVVNRSARSHALISASKAFNVNILADHQREVSNQFASKEGDPFGSVGHRFGSNGVPVIDDAVAFMECRIALETDFGTHTIFIGHVTAGSVAAGNPLIYQEGEYKSATPRISERDIAAMFLERWSPRAFDEGDIDDDRLMSFFEAARWAPSSMNSQPWRFVYVKRGEPAWQAVLDTLSNTNRLWASKAAALVAFVSKETMDYRGTEIASPTHSFDTGAAWMSLALQANLSGWHAHAMAGFDGERLRAVLSVPANFAINAVAAIGKLGDRSSLPEQLKLREIPSERSPLSSLVFNGSFAGAQ
jgi:flavin reductase (DIM6/NTAB) family NADH-FMN oxidoreductase RutF/nitroreductase